MAAQVGGGGSHEGGDGFGEHGCGRSEGVRRREQRWCGSNRCRARGGWCRVAGRRAISLRHYRSGACKGSGGGA